MEGAIRVTLPAVSLKVSSALMKSCFLQVQFLPAYFFMGVFIKAI